MNTWNELTAREWFDHGLIGWSDKALRYTMHHQRMPVTWIEPQPLPAAYSIHLPSIAHDCLADAIRLASSHDDILVAAGYSFRPESPAGIRHFFGLRSDGLPVDLAVDRLGLPVGYLATVFDAVALSQLARKNRLHIGTALLDRHDRQSYERQAS